MTSASAKKAKRRLPIFEGLLPLDPARIPADLIAGATLAALAIPEVMGYSKLAGMPVITGLYTIVLPVFAFAIFGSSRHLVVGADSATAVILATGLLALGATAESPQYVALAGLAALMCAVFLIVARVIRLGFLANFLSRSVLIGFLTGVGIQVAMGQLAGMLGVPSTSGGTIQKFVETLKEIPETSIPTLMVSIGVIAVIVGSGRINKKIPGPLIAVLGAIALSYVLDLEAEGVSVLGTVPGGLPPIGLPQGITLDDVYALLPTVFSLFIVILAQSAATSRAYAVKYGDSFDENVHLVGLGMANAAAGISGTFVVNGSPTKTEMVDSAGSRSQLAQLTTGAIVIIVLLFLTGPLSYMPNAVLAAVVFLIGIRLVDYLGMELILRLRPGEFAVAALTAATVVVVGVEQGIILAMVLSIVEHISHSYRPHDTLASLSESGGQRFVPLAERTQAAPGLVVFRFGANLYYANATRFTEEMLSLLEDADPPVRTICLSASAIGDIDFSGAGSIREVVGELKERGVRFSVCDVAPDVRAQLDRYGLTELIGSGNIHDDLQHAVESHKASDAATT